jgi:phage tail tube protein FII
VLIPDKLINFKAYGGAGGLEFLGLTDVELPKFDPINDKIMGAGIAGEIESPVVGHFASQTVKLKFRTVTRAALGLLAPVMHSLDIRGAVQVQDTARGQLVTQAFRVEVTGQQKGLSLGKLEPGKQMEADCEIEAVKLIISLDDVPLVELDKLNMIYKVNDTDYLAEARRAMGGV